MKKIKLRRKRSLGLSTAKKLFAAVKMFATAKILLFPAVKTNICFYPSFESKKTFLATILKHAISSPTHNNQYIYS